MLTFWSEGFTLYAVAELEHIKTTILQEITLMEREK
jgi:hypothetical protein